MSSTTSLLADATDACGCSLLEGRCETHAAMLRDIHEAWTHGDSGLMMCLWQYSDGYGTPGFVPDQGFDWSGIRDSSTAAIEAMHQVIA